MDVAVEAAVGTTDRGVRSQRGRYRLSSATDALALAHTRDEYARPGTCRSLRGLDQSAAARARLRLNAAGAWWPSPTSDDEHDHRVLRQSAPVLDVCAYGGGAAAT